jgi:hypothetical protein
MIDEFCRQHRFPGVQNPQSHPFTEHIRLHYQSWFSDRNSRQDEDLLVVCVKDDGEHVAGAPVFSVKFMKQMVKRKM